MSTLRSKAIQIITDFFQVTGPFSEPGPEGAAASSYPRTLARFAFGAEEELQSEIAGVLLDYAMDGSHPFSQGSAYLCSELALRGLAKAFTPHVSKIMEFFESRGTMGWWMTDASFEEAAPEANNAIPLINVLWCCDEHAARGLTDMLLHQTASQKLRASLMRSKLLPQALRSMADPKP